MGCGGDGWVVPSLVGYLSSSSLLSCLGCWEREGIQMVIERKKRNKLLSYKVTVIVHICTVTIANV